MDFVFEERKGPGNTSDVDTPKKPAVRITLHKASKKDARKHIRLYICFSPETIKEARWIKGDRLVAGADVKSGCICFKRDQGHGFTLNGSCFEKGRGNVNMQVSTSEDSPLWLVVKDHIGKWLFLSQQGLLIVASTR